MVFIPHIEAHCIEPGLHHVFQSIRGYGHGTSVDVVERDHTMGFRNNLLAFYSQCVRSLSSTLLNELLVTVTVTATFGDTPSGYFTSTS